MLTLQNLSEENKQRLKKFCDISTELYKKGIDEGQPDYLASMVGFWTAVKDAELNKEEIDLCQRLAKEKRLGDLVNAILI